MEGRQEGKLVTYICPTCGTALKFEKDKKSTTCPSCKNEVEKQFVVNLNFVSSSDDANFKNCYSYDKSLFKFNFDSTKDVINGIKKREFVEIPAHRLSPNDMLRLDSIIQELLFKMDKPNKLKDTDELTRMVNEILEIDDNNVYGVFLNDFLNGEPMTSVLSRRDALDKADFFVPYLITTNKILFRTFDDDVAQIITYVLNSTLKSIDEKYNCISSIFFEHLRDKHYFRDFAESIFILTSCDISIQLKQNIIKRLMDITLLNDYESLIKYIKVCISVNLSVNCIFSRNKLRCYLYGFDGMVTSRLIEYIWTLENFSQSKRLDYCINVLEQTLFSYPVNLTAQECASLINVLKDKPFKSKQLKRYFEQIVLLSLVEKVDINNLTKLENSKIKRQIRLNKLNKPNENGYLRSLWSFWREYWWNKPFHICCFISFIVMFSLIVIFNFERVRLLFTKDLTEAMSTLALAVLCSAALFIPCGAIVNTLIAPIKWLSLLFTTKIEYDQDIKVRRMSDRKNALIIKAERKNRDLKIHEEFENARLIAFLVETNLDGKLKKRLIELIKTPYIYESYDEVLNLIELINQSDYIDKENLTKYLILNCINICSYKDALTTLEFIKRLNLPSPKKDAFSKYLLYNKAKKSLTTVTGYLYLFSYLDKEVDRFKYMFNIICTYNKDLFYEINNVDVAYASGDISDDLYLLVCKSMIRFAYSSVTRDHFSELENSIKQRLYDANIKEFSLVNRMSNSKIIKWVCKKPLSEKNYNKDYFLLANKIK